MMVGEEGVLEGGATTAVNEPQLEPGSGVLEMHPNGYGFLRNPETNFSRERTDPFVPGTMIEKFRLREGVLINGMVQQPSQAARPAAQGNPRRRRHARRKTTSTSRAFDAAHADQSRRVAAARNRAARRSRTRVMDLLTPLGKGQRALIVAPPRTGKTILLQHISQRDLDQLSRTSR